MLLILAVMAAGCSKGESGGRPVDGPEGTVWLPMTAQRLPDLQVPRGNHRTLVFGDEAVVLGGHTDGFKPLETAEYFADGAWHTVPMVYPHASGFAARLQDGRILLGGGSGEDFGIGQSWGAEVYDPSAHNFTAVGIMTRKRALSSALTLPDGRVVIAGNWMADDGWETWSAEGGFEQGNPISPGWSCPFILPASKDDIILFGPYDSCGEDAAGTVEHLGGEKENIPLLEEWAIYQNYHFFPENIQIADYTYLLPAHRRDNNAAAIIKVSSGKFSLLEMENPLPDKGPDGNPIEWGHLQVDRPARLIWVQGFDAIGKIYFARIGYDATFDGGKASATLFYSDLPDDFPGGVALLMSGGRMIFAGGVGWVKGQIPVQVDFFKTYSSVYVFHTEPLRKAGIPIWVILLSILGICGIFLATLLLRRKPLEAPAAEDDGPLTRNLMEEMSALIEEKELYRQKNLRITEVASELATNKTYVSILLNNLSGESFTSLITRYRVEYAQKLLREHPDMLLDEVAEQSGFSSRTTFFRNFKSLTGLTPQEWKRQRT